MIGIVADDLVRLRRTSYAEIQKVFAEVARPGKPGMLKVANVLDERAPGHVPPHSELERALFDTLAAGGLPAPQRQVPLPGRSRIRGLADGAYLDARIVLEADGRRWHDRVQASHRDRLRDLQVVRAGWVPMRFDHHLILSDPAEVCSAVRETRAERLRLLDRAA